ncbi:protein disulfide oxidoreductase [Prauserella muralis]|uniref:Uncharacterized protein n=1 Tax=Prauserella muralis TaxID=588067 RepID=A0A2V4ALU7_9PSEU|nr:protein disulfide oxidoreductase [Prauserella muralis]PXY21271.1 hypothetical protein BAY60_27865 [Prauserella muralis]TWE30385.1 thiol-disulfide isomerase/thioredoxin [Prauserella muralis]
MSSRARSLGVLLGAVTLAATVAACGSRQPDSGAPATSGTAPASATSQAETSAPSSPETSGSASRPAPPVPDELRFSATTLDGKPFSGESLAGKPAVLWFWAPWCPNCRAEAPSLASTAKAHQGSVTFVGVASQDDAGPMRDFVRDYGVGGFPHLNDSGGELWQRFGVTYQPAYAFVSADGTVEVVKQQLPEDELARRVAELAGA